MWAERTMDGASFGVLGNCVISVWRAPARSDLLVAYNELVAEAAQQHDAKLVFLLVLEHGATVFTGNQRQEVEASYARWEHRLSATAQVVEGRSLWAATVRSMMNALRMIERHPYQTKIFAELAPAVLWSVPFLEHANGSVSAAELEAAVRRLSNNLGSL